MTAISGLLRDVPLLSGLNDDQLKAVANIAQRRSFRAGDEIARGGAPVDAAFYLIDGPIECLATENQAAISHVPKGATLLELAMIVDIDAGATCVARGSVKMLEIRRQAMHDLMETELGLTDAVLESLTERLVEVAAAMREADETFAELQKIA